jgi:hypothetical protein
MIDNSSKVIFENIFYRPSIGYRHAFNWCAVQVQQLTNPILVVSSKKIYAYELERRLRNSQIITVQICNLFNKRSRFVLSEDVENDNQPITKKIKSTDLSAIIWAEPEIRTGKQIAQSLNQYLSSGDYLYIIGSGYIRKSSPIENDNEGNTDNHPAGIIVSKKWLRELGYDILAYNGFQSPISYILGYLAKILQVINRQDISDWCYYKIRKSLVVHGWIALGSPVYVIKAIKR